MIGIGTSSGCLYISEVGQYSAQVVNGMRLSSSVRANGFIQWEHGATILTSVPVVSLPRVAIASSARPPFALNRDVAVVSDLHFVISYNYVDALRFIFKTAVTRVHDLLVIGMTYFSDDCICDEGSRW